jgi:uncharacterized protein (TIGR02302 family)
LTAGLPKPHVAARDPVALRALVLVLVIAAFFVGGNERLRRVAAAFDWQGVIAPTTFRIDAWVSPPAYTSKPPLILQGLRPGEPTPQTSQASIAVPAGSILVVRASGQVNLDVSTTGGLAEPEDAAQPAASHGASERRFTIDGDGSATVRGSGLSWQFTAVPDHPPTIALVGDPQSTANGLQLSYKIEDDYGVVGARAIFTLSPRSGTNGHPPRNLYDAPEFPLSLPQARTRNGVGQTVKDLSEDPYAGADVTLTLTAKDEAGNEARSEPFNMRLPERLFTNSLARALIEQRRILALDANRNSDVYTALDALMIAPELFTPDAGCYLGLRNLATQLEAARTDDALRNVVASMWAFATTIEDDGVAGSVNAALRSAQDALKAALERGASEDELRVLTQKLREAMAGKVRDLARRAEQNPLGARQPFPAEVQLILDKAVELRQKTQKATPEQLADLAQQQDVLREQLQAYRKSANSRANKAGDDKTNQFTRDRKCGS